MPETSPLLSTKLNGVDPHRRGKVRDLYETEDSHLIVSTDRISAFDYVLGSGIPDKGKVLTQLSAFWFTKTQHIVPNHLIGLETKNYPSVFRKHSSILKGRSMLVHRTKPLPVECVARGYLSGSGWKEYQSTGSISGVQLPPGLRESERLPKTIFTPATKATSGHDVNITEEDAGLVVGKEIIHQLRNFTLQLYEYGLTHASECGLILADTKFEFGLTPTGEIMLIDEIMTPDSSRYWPKDLYQPGKAQPSFDKQYVRDYLEEIKWNKKPPVPSLPDKVVQRTRHKYLEAYKRLTGQELE